MLRYEYASNIYSIMNQCKGAATMREEVLKMVEQLDEENAEKALNLAVALLSAQKESQKENPKSAPCSPA